MKKSSISFTEASLLPKNFYIQCKNKRYLTKKITLIQKFKIACLRHCTLHRAIYRPQLILIIVGLKKTFKRVDVWIDCVEQPFCNYIATEVIIHWSFEERNCRNCQLRSLLALDIRLHSMYITHTHTRALPLPNYFIYWEISQATSSLFFSTQNSKDSTHESRKLNWDSIL